uniref:Uncharacterized protein n=1 Tax=Aegilops tauschii subsp. strangulata TaxID=200361 RepID=A0A453PIN1_AEGTS
MLNLASLFLTKLLVPFHQGSDRAKFSLRLVQQPSRKKGKETPLNSSSSSVEMEHFPRLSDADLLCPFDFHDMLVPTSSSVMCNDEIMSSSAARSSPDDLVSAYASTKNNQPRATPDMILDEMAGNPLEMYFPPLATCEQPQVPMSGTASTLAGDGALNGAALQSGSRGRRGSGGVREKARPSSVPEAAPAPVRHLGFQKLQEGLNQLDVGTKACIRDALYRLAYSVEHRQQVVEPNVGSSAANRLSTSSVWAETERSPMDRSVAQLLLKKPLDQRTANRAA